MTAGTAGTNMFSAEIRPRHSEPEADRRIDPGAIIYEEAARGHMTDCMRNLGERLLHASDLSYEDITGQAEPLRGQPDSTRRKHSDKTSKTPNEKDKWMWTRISKAHARERQTDRLQPSAPTADRSSDTAQQETKEVVMTTRGAELTNLKQQFSQQLRMKFWYSAHLLRRQ